MDFDVKGIKWKLKICFLDWNPICFKCFIANTLKMAAKKASLQIYGVWRKYDILSVCTHCACILWDLADNSLILICCVVKNTKWVKKIACCIIEYNVNCNVCLWIWEFRSHMPMKAQWNKTEKGFLLIEIFNNYLVWNFELWSTLDSLLFVDWAL